MLSQPHGQAIVIVCEAGPLCDGGYAAWVSGCGACLLQFERQNFGKALVPPEPAVPPAQHVLAELDCVRHPPLQHLCTTQASHRRLPASGPAQTLQHLIV